MLPVKVKCKKYMYSRKINELKITDNLIMYDVPSIEVVVVC